MTRFSGWSGFRDTLLTAPPKPWQDILLLTLLWALASLPWLLGNHFNSYDSFDEFYPQSWFVVNSLRQGDWPWWNPYQYAGLPMFGDAQAMLFSMHTMVGLLLGSHYTLHVFDRYQHPRFPFDGGAGRLRFGLWAWCAKGLAAVGGGGIHAWRGGHGSVAAHDPDSLLGTSRRNLRNHHELSSRAVYAAS